MENNEQKPTPFLKRVSDLEQKVNKLELKINAILNSLKSRR